MSHSAFLTGPHQSFPSKAHSRRHYNPSGLMQRIWVQNGCLHAGRHFNGSAPKKKNKYNFVEQFQRSEIPCPRSLRSFGNQSAVNPLLIAAFAEQVKRRKPKQEEDLFTHAQTCWRTGCLSCFGLIHLLLGICIHPVIEIMEIDFPICRGEGLPKQSDGSFVQVILSYREKKK